MKRLITIMAMTLLVLPQAAPAHADTPFPWDVCPTLHDLHSPVYRVATSTNEPGHPIIMGEAAVPPRCTRIFIASDRYKLPLGFLITVRIVWGFTRVYKPLSTFPAYSNRWMPALLGSWRKGDHYNDPDMSYLDDRWLLAFGRGTYYVEMEFEVLQQKGNPAAMATFARVIDARIRKAGG